MSSVVFVLDRIFLCLVTLAQMAFSVAWMLSEPCICHNKITTRKSQGCAGAGAARAWQ